MTSQLIYDNIRYVSNSSVGSTLVEMYWVSDPPSGNLTDIKKADEAN